MGQFSFLDCKTGEQIINNEFRRVYVLLPESYGGGHITEACYRGYGEFGGVDIFELLADMNRTNLDESLIDLDNEMMRRLVQEFSVPDLREDFDSYAEETFGSEWKRDLGIELFYNGIENQFADLEYPLKITYDSDAFYEDIEGYSDRDPDQGLEPEEIMF